MQTGSKELIRDMNMNLVLELIVNSKPISRAAISKILGLTKATISAIVGELINRKYIIEIGSDDTNLGRKPILLSFNRKAGYAVSVDIGEQMMSALVTDLQGEERQLKQISTPIESRMIPSVLIELIHSMTHSLPKSPYGIVGITLGIHGVVSDNEVLFTPYYDLRNIPLVQELENHFNTNVTLENEANLSVIGEKTFEYNYPNIANISVHTGVGLGLIMNDSLYSGRKGYAGEVGHTIIEVNGRQCPCGNHGCLEQYASERALLLDLAERKGLNSLDFATFSKLYSDGDKDAIEMIDTFVLYMSVCVNNILNLYNPDLIIINSRFVVLIPELIQRVESSLNSHMNNYVRIVPSALNESSVLLGGISVAVRTFLGVDINMVK
ncbi:MAG TPA: ROK family transcriptional regulator [Lachnospiraceae bacterium]|nr:ROK family transcriptional regulator [Lachnospiraceae bacterium]